jgi:hypothetical protein
MKDVRVLEAFKRAWEGAKNNAWLYLLLGGIYLGVGLLNLAVGKIAGDGSLASLLVSCVGTVSNLITGMVLVQLNLQIMHRDGAKLEGFSEMAISAADFGRYLLTQLFFGAILLGALFLCLVPVGLAAMLSLGLAFFSREGLGQFALPFLLSVAAATAAMAYLLLLFGQCGYACLDQGLGPWEALMESRRLTDGAKGGLLRLILASLGLAFVGLCCLLVGLIPAVVVVLLAHAMVYGSLLQQSGPRPRGL